MKLNTIDFSLHFEKGEDSYGVDTQFIIDNNISNESFWDGNEFCIDLNILLPTYWGGICGYLFTCGCSDHGCAGIYNECCIVHQQDFITWMIPQKTWSSIDDCMCDYDLFYFDKRKYKQKLYEFSVQINDLQDNYFVSPHWVVPSRYDINLDMLLHKHKFEMESLSYSYKE